MVSIKAIQVAVVAVVAVSASSLGANASPMPRVDPRVHRTLRQQGSVNLIVTLKESNADTINSVKESSFPSRQQKIETLVAKLKAHATATQAGISQLLTQESSTNGATPLFQRTQSLWISNQVSFKDASFELVEKLSTLPSIGEIREELVFSAPKIRPHGINTTSATTLASNEWGVTKIQASDVWAAGFDGQGVVVGTIDSGVQHTHEALAKTWRHTYGWFDPTANKTEPYDDSGHGTHATGTIAGTRGIGVAPGAQWIACRGCSRDKCHETDLIACGQFMTCPTDAAGSNRDCSQAPRVVSNSWGSTGGNSFFEPVITTWQAAGIIPIFSNGNDGECDTTNSPADSANVISVGMTDEGDTLAWGSSMGPSVGGLIKPEITAPGADVRSAWIGEDTSYVTETGTSMAAPHVSGVVALLLSAKPLLTYADIKKILLSTTDTASLQPSGYTCGGTADTTFPNNQYGHGRINALKAFNQATGVNATPVPTPAPTPPPPCVGLPFFRCARSPECRWGENGCELKSVSSTSGSGSVDDPTEEPTEEPTETPTPTTPEPTPAPPTPLPTRTTPTPTVKTTSKPPSKAPTPAPSTIRPPACGKLGFRDCVRSNRCKWGFFTGRCKSIY